MTVHKPDCQYYTEVVKSTYICTCGAEMTNSSVTLCHHWSEQTGATATGFGVLTTRMPACPWCVIEQLHAAVKTAQELAATRLMEIERLRGEAEVADEQLAQLRGFAEAHKNCRGSDEPCELRPPVKLEDYGPVIDEVAPVTKEAWDAMKLQGASRDASSTYRGYPDGTCQECGQVLGDHVCPTSRTNSCASFPEGINE